MTLDLQVVAQSLVRGERVAPQYVQDARFNPSWWGAGHAKSPVFYCSLLRGGEEVARAKVRHGAGEYGGHVSWSRPRGGATEIDLLEVWPDLRRSGREYGRRAVEAVAAAFGGPVVALSLNDASDAFWWALGWVEHRHPDGARSLFTSA